MIVLGQKVESPYDLDNMRQALTNLRKSYRSNGVSITHEIDVTHHYVKFLPQSEAHLDSLSYDPNLVLYGYPLDREIVKSGSYYIDPDAPLDKPMPLYATVEVDHVLPTGVPYEILTQLHNPESDEDYTVISNVNGRNSRFIEDLVDEAFRLIGNSGVGTAPNARSKKWTPSGTIRSYDSSKNRLIGIYGLKVRIRGGFFTQTRFTNSNGYFRSNRSYRRDVYYSFNFERYDFEIRPIGRSSPANVTSAKKRIAWAMDFSSSDDRKAYATFFRAAFHYYYGDRQGLSSPPENAFLRRQLKIHEGGTNARNGVYNPNNGATIYNLKSRNSDAIYGTVIHELAHAAHWKLSKSDYDHTSTIVAESWARGVEWALTSSEYPDFIPKYKGAYTGVVQDMIDSDVNSPKKDNSTITPSEYVTGYSISQIEQALIRQRSWTAWRDNIKSKHVNATEKHLDALFDYWD